MTLPKDFSPYGPNSRTLYHYTSLDAFQKIVESQCLWATDARFLNDTNELKSVREILKAYGRYWNTLRPDPPLSYVAQDIISEAIDILDKKTLPPIYVASFSTQEDQLAQWSGYCSSGAGICFGVSEKALTENRPDSGFTLFDCSYAPRDEPDYCPNMLKGLDQIINSYEHGLTFGWTDQPENAEELIREELASQRYADFLETHRAELPKHLAAIKDDSWEAEYEVRAVLATHSKNGIEFRTNGGQLIPYKKLPLPTRDGALIIESVCHWASPAPSETEIALKTFLDANRVQNVFGQECLVRPSKNPFRPRLR